MSISIMKYVGIVTWPMMISAIQVGRHHYEEHLTFSFILGKIAIIAIDDKIWFSVVPCLKEQHY